MYGREGSWEVKEEFKCITCMYGYSNLFLLQGNFEIGLSVFTIVRDVQSKCLGELDEN